MALICAVSLGVPQPLSVFARGSQALRPSQDVEGHRFVRAGLEEPSHEKPAPFVPWPAALGKVLVRRGPHLPIPNYHLETAQRLEQVLRPLVQPSLRSEFGMKETPLIYLEHASRVLEKPVYLFREALLPTGSSKPRMLAALFDLYLNGDPKNLTGRREKPLPNQWGTQSTGNHLLAMAWGAAQVRKRKEWSLDRLSVLGFTMRGIPEGKKRSAKAFGATILDHHADYGKAREDMKRTAVESGDAFLYWHHGDRPIILGNMTAAVQLGRQIQLEKGLKGKRIAVVSAAGSGGRLAGWAAGLTQLLPERVKVIGAETPRVPPVFEGVRTGKPVPIQLPPERVSEDGIAVDQVEPDALEVILQRADAVALVDPKEALSYTHWLRKMLVEVRGPDSEPFPPDTEVVTGMSLAVPFLYPGLFSDVAAVIVDETGRNIDPDDRLKVKAAPLPVLVRAGLEETPTASSPMEDGFPRPGQGKPATVEPGGIDAVLRFLPFLAPPGELDGILEDFLRGEMTFQAAVDGAYQNDTEHLSQRTKALIGLTSAWVAARYGLNQAETSLLQDLLRGTTPVQQVLERLLNDRILPNKLFLRPVTDRLIVEALSLYEESRHQQHLPPSDHLPIAGVLAAIPVTELTGSPPGADSRVWAIWPPGGGGDSAARQETWSASPVKVRPGYGDGLEHHFPNWESNVLPVPSAQGEASEAFFSGRGMGWIGYLSAEGIPLPPELQDPGSWSGFRYEGNGREKDLLAGDYLWDRDSPPEQRERILQILRSHVQLWGHYWLRPNGNGVGDQERMVQMRPDNVSLVNGTLTIRFSAEVRPSDHVTSPFIGELLLRGHRYALNRDDQKAWIWILPSLYEGAKDPPTRVDRMRQLIAAGRTATVFLAPKPGDNPISRLPVENGALIQRMVSQAVEQAASSRRSATVYGNLDLGDAARSEIMDPGALERFASTDSINTPIDWFAETPEGISIGVRQGSNAAFVFEGPLRASDRLIDLAGESIGSLQKGEPVVRRQMVKVEAEPGADGTLRVFLAPRNLATDGMDWKVLAKENLHPVDRFPGQAGIATESEIQKYGFGRMDRYPGTGAPVTGPMFPSGVPLLGARVDALAVHGGILIESNGPAYYGPFYLHRVRLAMKSVGLPADHPLIRGERDRLSAQFQKDPREADRRQMREWVQRILAEESSLNDLLEAVTALRDSGRRLRYERAFQDLDVVLQNQFTRRILEIVQREGHSGRLDIQPVFGQPIARDLPDGTGAVVVAHSPTLDLTLDLRPSRADGQAAGWVIRYRVGGSAAHVAQAVNRVNPRARVDLIGPFGGETGEMALRTLRDQGIHVQALPDGEMRVAVNIARPGAQDEIRLVPNSSAGPMEPGRVSDGVSAALMLRGQDRPLVIGDRLPGTAEQQMETAGRISDQIAQIQSAGAPAVVSVNSSWAAEAKETILSSRPRWLFLTVEGLAGLVGEEDHIRLREDEERVAELIDLMRIRRRISGGILVSLHTAGLVVSARAGNVFAWPPGEFWRAYTGGATDSASGDFLETLLRNGEDASKAAAVAETGFAVVRGRPPEDRGLPATAEEIRTGPIARMRPLPRTRAASVEQSRWDRFSALMERLDGFPASADAAAQQKWWDDLQSDLVELLDYAVLPAGERLEILRRLFRIRMPLVDPAVRRSFYFLLWQALEDPMPEIREFAERQWLEWERAVFQPIAGKVGALPGRHYRVEIEQALLEGLDTDSEWGALKGQILQAVERAGGHLEITSYDKASRVESDVRRVALLRPEQARSAPLEDLLLHGNRQFKLRVLPVENAFLPSGRARLLSRAVLLALVVASQPEEGSAFDEADLLALRRYFQLLEINVSAEEIRNYLTLAPDRDEWLAALAQMTLHLGIPPLKPLTTISFTKFKEYLQTDLSA